VTECELLQRLDEARQNLRDAKGELERFYANRLSAKLELKVGDVIQDPEGSAFVITRFLGRSYGGDVFGVKIKKDGTPGLREQCIYFPEKCLKV